MARVSVVIPSFNHQDYIGECIQSVLQQTYQDFEIIITDDGSSDNTVAVIKQFEGPKIQLYTHDTNIGACTAINNCIRKSSGEYISVLNSDDIYERDKLEKQVAYLDSHPEVGAVFSRAAFIDEFGNPVPAENYEYYYIFEKENRSKYAWLNYFFYHGNCLCHPSILIRRSCYDEIGLYNERLANLPDMDMWVRLCLRYEIHILDEKLVRMRIRSDRTNVSGDLLPNQVRMRFEYMQILNHYLDVRDKPTFLSIFPEAEKYGKVEQEYIQYFIAMLSMNIEYTSGHLWGLQLLYDFMGDKATADGLENTYGFRYRDFIEMTAKQDVFNLQTAGPNTAFWRQGGFGDYSNRGILLRFAIRLHWMLAGFVRKYILK